MFRASFLPEFEHEMAVTRTVLERIPDDVLDWQPHDESFTLRGLAAHAADIPSWVAVIVDQVQLDVADCILSPPGDTRDDLLRIFDENVAAARETLASAPDETLMDTWRLVHGEHEYLSMPRVAVLRSFVLNHLIHHRGQLTVYLRLKHVPLPSVYGPSADEDAF